MLIFDCSTCRASYEIDDDLAGKTIRCRECSDFGRVLSPKKRPTIVASIKQTLQHAEPPSHLSLPESPSEQKFASQARGQDWLRGSVFLWGIGAVLLIAALVVSHNLKEQDARQDRIDDALYRFAVNIGGPTSRQSPQGDRTPVYFLFGLGAICFILGVVCRTIENQTQSVVSPEQRQGVADDKKPQTLSIGPMALGPKASESEQVMPVTFLNSMCHVTEEIGRDKFATFCAVAAVFIFIIVLVLFHV